MTLAAESISSTLARRESNGQVAIRQVVEVPRFDTDVVIVGGLGHVGLPLGLTFAKKGFSVCLYDTNFARAEQVRKGIMPFLEDGAAPILKEVLSTGKLEISTDVRSLSRAKYVVIGLPTPVDEYMNPKTRVLLEAVAKLKENLSSEQTIIVRSTVYPRTCEQIANMLGADGKRWNVAYCPERIVQGQAMKELTELPQLVSGLTETAVKKAKELFGTISPRVIEVSVGEAEIAKLFSNAWRYVQFAVANQFYMICKKFGTDYNRTRDAMRDGYKRDHALPSAGFAGGPCLLKDTMQLAAFNANNFLLGHAAMMINEGLPSFIVEEIRTRWDLAKTRVGILGMAYKADIDDIRDSLSYKLGKILRFHGAKVYYSDEYAKDPTFVPKETIVSECDVVIVGVPHSAYKELRFSRRSEVIDLWGITGKSP